MQLCPRERSTPRLAPSRPPRNPPQGQSSCPIPTKPNAPPFKPSRCCHPPGTAERERMDMAHARMVAGVLVGFRQARSARPRRTCNVVTRTRGCRPHHTLQRRLGHGIGRADQAVSVALCPQVSRTIVVERKGRRLFLSVEASIISEQRPMPCGVRRTVTGVASNDLSPTHRAWVGNGPDHATHPQGGLKVCVDFECGPHPPSKFCGRE
jgi:hypothetical protein